MTRRILLVEDDPSDEKLAIRAFKQCQLPHEIVVARDGAEALESLGLRASAAQATRGSPAHLPRLVLLDLKLPRIDGLDVLREIRQSESSRLLPVVVLSASREEEDLYTSLALGANAYVRKPLDYKQFVETARTLVEFWLGLNEPIPPRVVGARQP